MRYLNKIVFINSAAVQYAEIELDGNVHLIGTQGVGKSTLLRAILFFYNADKTKLGIPREKQNFDDYYFPYQNSYILYEVVKDEVPFCVLAYKVNGKTAFRFFDSGYERALFITGNNRARESWADIRNTFGRHIHYTPIISSYKEFRQIIYGDNKGLQPKYRKYALLESRQYQNIPRTIQNVFLNAKLEAKFIKGTIIKSLNEEEFSIDLENYLKNHLRDFETQINDINSWFKANKKGQIIIRKQADKIIARYRKFTYLKREKKELAHELAARMAFIENEKPALTSQLQRETEALNTLTKERDHLKTLHRQREQKLISEIDYLKKELKKAKEKETDYQAQNIGDVLRRVEEKPFYQQEKTALEKEKQTLTAEFSEIEEKFDALLRQVNNQLQEFKNNQKAEINRIEEKFNVNKTKLQETYARLVKQIEEDHRAQKEKAKNEFGNLKDTENRLQNQKSELKHKRFFENEIAALRTENDKLSRSLSEYKNAIIRDKDKKATLRKEYELEIEKTERETKIQKEKARENQNANKREIDRIADKINRSENSLYGWLNAHVPNWGETIGKVIDEDEVLFHSGLNPKLTNDKAQHFFGVALDLEALEPRIKTLNNYRQDIKGLETENTAIQKQINELEEEKTAALQRLKRRFKKKIGVLDDRIAENDYTLSQNEKQIKQHTIELENWSKKAAQEKEGRLKALEEKLDETTAKKLSAWETQERIEKSIQRKISLKNTERDKKITALKTEKDEKIGSIKKVIAQKEKTSEERLKQLKQKKNSSLSEKGVDTQRLEAIEEQLTEITQELTFIENHEALVIEYKKDKRELLDRVPQHKAKRKRLEHKQENLVETHQKEQEKFNRKHHKQEELVNSTADQIKTFETDERKFEAFKKSTAFPGIEAELAQPNPKTETGKLAASIIDAITEKHYDGMETFKALQQATNVFVGNFSEKNIFKFKVNLNVDEEYMQFALDLKEFIEEDKIEEYEKRVNERFAHIIQLIGKETNELLSKEAEIEKVIRKVNTDFMRKNFVEAIKEMEMRIRESSHPVVRLLKRIRDFNDENNLILGETNLFNTTGAADKNKKAVALIKQLIKELEKYKNPSLSLSESFDLQFRIVENDNNSGWVEKLANVGSEGTDVLVKAMINILLLNVFKESVSKRFKDFKLHCMMDEIGRLHPTNIKGILRFANERNIYLINGSPISQSAIDYKYTYKLAKQQAQSDPKKYITKVNRLVKINPKALAR